MSKMTISAIHGHVAKEWNGKFFHEFNVDGSIDGDDREGVVISFYSKTKDKPDVKEGGTYEVEFSKEYKGVDQYKGKLPYTGGGGGGGGRPAPRNEAQIVAQSSLKTAVEYFSSIGSTDHSPEDVIECAERFMKWVQSK